MGTSPPAKRSARRQSASPPQDVPNLTLEEVCTFVAQHKAQHVLDKMWMETVQTAITDHAEKLNAAETTIATHDSGLLHLDKNIEGVEMGYDHCQTNITVVRSDLIRSNELIQHNDSKTKEVSAANDTAVKTAMNTTTDALKVQMDHVTQWLAARDKDSQALVQKVDMIHAQMIAGVTAPASVTNGDELMATLMGKVNGLNTRLNELDLTMRSGLANSEQRQLLTANNIRNLHVSAAAAAAPTSAYAHVSAPAPAPAPAPAFAAPLPSPTGAAAAATPLGAHAPFSMPGYTAPGPHG